MRNRSVVLRDDYDGIIPLKSGSCLRISPVSGWMTMGGGDGCVLQLVEISSK